MNLVEQYKNRLAVSESVYSKTHNGEKMDSYKKVVLAKVLDNTNKFLNEAFDASIGTQRADMGEFKKFCLNLTTVALPNLIAPELVIVSPMSSITGYISYLEYTAGVDKGGVERGDLFNGTFALGEMTEDRMRYSGDRVVESYENIAQNDVETLMWQPVDGSIDANGIHASIIVRGANGTALTEGTDFVVGYTDDTNTFVDCTTTPAAVPAGANVQVKFLAAIATGAKIGYVYDNIIVPQPSLPTIRAEVKGITLKARARRIAIFYNQMAAFQSKTDYGFDLGEQLASQACGELAYEIDSEVVQLLADYAKVQSSLNWSKVLPVGVSKAEHYEGFMEVVEQAKVEIYKATGGKFNPNYMLCSADVIPILSFIKGWAPAPAAVVRGPYFAGTLGSLKVFVSPLLENKFIVGVNGGDLMTAAAVYAPYMPCVPTQLLGFADGGMSQGFSTLYDLQPLSVYHDATDNKDYSRLIVSGNIQ